MSGEVLAVGVSWKSAPVSIREAMAFPEKEITASLTDLLAHEQVNEALIVSTCNRVEFYLGVEAVNRSQVNQLFSWVNTFISERKRITAEQLGEYTFELVGKDAVRHLMTVTSALDSIVIGEAQILGQVKGAYSTAIATGALNGSLQRAVEHAFRCAKKVRTETGVSKGAANVASVSVDLAKRVLGDLSGRTIGVLGAGKMSALAVQHLRAQRVGGISVANRSLQRAEELAGKMGGAVVDWEDREQLLRGSDVVIFSTAAQQALLNQGEMKGIMKQRRFRPIVVLDIAVPRNVDPAVAGLDGVFLFDVDDLQSVVAGTMQERNKAAVLGQEIVDEQTAEFLRWKRGRQNVAIIKALQGYGESLLAKELDAQGLDAGSPGGKACARVIKKMLHGHLQALRDPNTPQSYIDRIIQDFQLELETHEPRGAVRLKMAGESE